MNVIIRETISDWINFLCTQIDIRTHKYTIINLPNGPYSSLNDAKNEISDLIKIYNCVLNSDLYHSCNFELNQNRESLIMKTTRKSLKNGHRPLAEAGAPLDTLDVEFNTLKYQDDVRKTDKSLWPIGIKTVNGNIVKNISETPYSREDCFQVTDKFFELLKINDPHLFYKNSFLNIHKCISDPTSSTVVHYLNPCNMTFIFKGIDVHTRINYWNYVTDVFSEDFQFYWDSNLIKHYIDPKYSLELTRYRWHCREMYHLVDDYYAITISKSANSPNSHKLMNDMIEYGDRLPFNWKKYPGNLYIGNVCKILSKGEE